MSYMLFGFHEYRRSIAERFSNKNRIFFLIVSLFVSILMSAVGFMYLNDKDLTILTFAQEKTVEPIPENYTEPLVEPGEYVKTRKQVIGFLPYWAIGQNAKVYPEYMDQIIYFGINIDEQGNLMKYNENNEPLIEWTYLNSEYFKTLQNDAEKTNTKISVAIKNFDNAQIDTLISNPIYSANGINQIVKLVADHDLDGINIDFEYFTDTDFPTLQHYNKFLTDLATELRKVNPDIIISFDVNASVVYNDNAYDMVKIGEVTDQIIIMGYDYHQTSSYYAGPVSPINAEGDKPSLTRTVKSLEGRVDKSKIILGVPFYGYEWQTNSKEQNSRTVPNTGAVASYKRVRELITSRDDIELHFDEVSQSPWLVYNQNGLIKQIYYEDEKSLLEKINFIHSNDLEGIAFWALGYEGTYIEPWEIVTKHMRTIR